jgi:hypothetical protein
MVSLYIGNLLFSKLTRATILVVVHLRLSFRFVGLGDPEAVSNLAFWPKVDS